MQDDLVSYWRISVVNTERENGDPVSTNGKTVYDKHGIWGIHVADRGRCTYVHMQRPDCFHRQHEPSSMYAGSTGKEGRVNSEGGQNRAPSKEG